MVEDKSCRPWDKPFYTVAEAAAYWCQVAGREIRVDSMGLPERDPQNACLRTRAEWIMDAINCGELPCGREGGQNLQEHVAKHRRTVRRAELRQWFLQHRPASERPAFLFDEIERNTHSSITPDAYRALKAAHDAKEQKLSQANERIRQLEEEKTRTGGEMQGLRATVEKMAAPSERSEATYQNIIAALLACIAGNLPNVEKHPSFESEAKLIEAIDEHFRGYGGLSKSNLSRKFPEAKRAIQSQ